MLDAMLSPCVILPECLRVWLAPPVLVQRVMPKRSPIRRARIVPPHLLQRIWPLPFSFPRHYNPRCRLS
ncbi:hypothetical protein GOODEAATRI_006418, partial [Goodea atripinnis]